MVNLIIIALLAAIVFQTILAIATANDANSRGHSGTKWLILTLIFGIFAILLYLITRDDKRLPEEEQPEKITGLDVGVYISAIAIGGIVFLLVGGLIAPLLFPVPCTGTDDAGETTHSGIKCGTDDITKIERIANIQENRQQSQAAISGLLFLLGIIMSPTAVYIYRN